MRNFLTFVGAVCVIVAVGWLVVAMQRSPLERSVDLMGGVNAELRVIDPSVDSLLAERTASRDLGLRLAPWLGIAGIILFVGGAIVGAIQDSAPRPPRAD